MATEAQKVTWAEVAAPSTPAAGKVVTYAKADGLMYSKDDAGAETLMSAGAGGAPSTLDYLVGTATGSLSAEIVVGTTQAVCDGRLTLTTALPVTTADVTAATTLYFTPYKGNRISTYSGTAWSTSVFTEKSITLATLTAGLPYDVYIVDSTLALELTAWTNGTTRATAIALQDGVYVKSGTTTRRYLGTICIAATGQCEDSVLKRFVYNHYNQVERELNCIDTTNSWTYGTATWRQANAAAGNKVEYVCGVSERPVKADVLCTTLVVTAQGGEGIVGVGIDSTSANSARILHPAVGTTQYYRIPSIAHYRGYPGVGYHYVAWLEQASATITFEGDNGGVAQSGLMAEVWG